MPKPKIGKIITPKGAIPKPHELSLAEILIHTGHDVYFLIVGPNKTPDIHFFDKLWEIKSPIGNSSRTIENNLRNALKQSENVIIDLRRTEISDHNAIQYITNHIGNFHGLKNLIIITKNSEILKISPKTSCITKIHMLK